MFDTDKKLVIHYIVKIRPTISTNLFSHLIKLPCYSTVMSLKAITSLCREPVSCCRSFKAVPCLATIMSCTFWEHDYQKNTLGSVDTSGNDRRVMDYINYILLL